AGGLAVGIAAVAIGRVAVVADLTRGEDAVAAAGGSAVGVAAVAVGVVAVIAELAGIDDTGAADDEVPAVRARRDGRGAGRGRADETVAGMGNALAIGVAGRRPRRLALLTGLDGAVAAEAEALEIDVGRYGGGCAVRRDTGCGDGERQQVAARDQTREVA